MLEDSTSPDPRAPFKRESWIQPAEAVIVWIVLSWFVQGIVRPCCGSSWDVSDLFACIFFAAGVYLVAGRIRSKVFFFETGCINGLLVVLSRMPRSGSWCYHCNLIDYGLPWFAVIMAYGLGCRTAAMLRHALMSRRSSREQPRCEVCGYLLYGLTEPRCPECGTAFEKVIPPLPS